MIYLKRTRNHPSQTIGHLTAIVQGKPSLFLHTLELPDLNNERRISRIPEGTYDIVKHVSPRFGQCLWLQNIPGRSEILIHAGNTPRDTSGCILVGFALDGIEGRERLLASRAALKALLETVPNEFKIVIE